MPSLLLEAAEGMRVTAWIALRRRTEDEGRTYSTFRRNTFIVRLPSFVKVQFFVGCVS